MYNTILKVVVQEYLQLMPAVLPEKKDLRLYSSRQVRVSGELQSLSLISQLTVLVLRIPE